LARAYKSQLAHLKAVDQVLQDMTPIQTCTDVEGLENHLKNLDSKNKMVMEELTRINKAQQESQKESIELKKELEELKKSASQAQEFDFISSISTINENLSTQAIALDDPVVVVLKDFFNSFEKKFGKRLIEIEDPDIVEKARKLDSVQNDFDQITQSKKELEDKVESLSSDIKDYKEQASSSKQENQGLKEKVQSLESQVDELSTSSSKASDTEKKLNEKIQDLESQVDGLSASSSKASDIEKKLKEKVQDLESQVDELSNSASKASDLEKQLDELKETNKRTIADLEDKLEKSLKSLDSKVAQAPPSPTTNNKKKKKGKSNNTNSNSTNSTSSISADEVSQIKSQLQHSNDNLSHFYQALDSVHSKVLENKLPISISDPSTPIELSKLKEASENIIKQWNESNDENIKSKKRSDIMNNLMSDLKNQLESKDQEINDLKLDANDSSKSEQKPLDCEKCKDLESNLEKINIENEELKVRFKFYIHSSFG
jgi:chromosome segregation ATPase